MGIISGLGSFRGQFGDHFRVGDHFGVGIISGAVQISIQNLQDDQVIWDRHYTLKYIYFLKCSVPGSLN